MRARRFDWFDEWTTARQIREWVAGMVPPPAPEELTRILDRVAAGGDAAVLEYTRDFDAPDAPPASLRVGPGEIESAVAGLEPALREALELALDNIRAVAEAQVAGDREIELPQGQTVWLRDVPVGAAGVYAPGGRAAYPSTALMCCVPAAVAGVERIALATPPGPDGKASSLVLAAAGLCGVDEVYAMGGAQAVFALAYGTESIAPVDVVVGPGNAWVREAKRLVSGERGIDSLAGPSELMVIAGHDADPEWIALDLCAQAEHGEDSPLIVAAVEARVLDLVETAAASVAETRPSVADAPLGLVHVPDAEAAIALANAYAPEHLELAEDDARLLADRVRTAGCVFVGHGGATAFGDYVAGSNHVLPTGGAGRFSGPLGPGTFRRKISAVEIPPDAAAKLAPHVDAIARAEGFPVHGESAMIRAEENSRT
jgi:histidinol dehydrogenase